MQELAGACNIPPSDFWLMEYRELINYIYGAHKQRVADAQDFYNRARWQIAAIFGKKPTQITRFPWETIQKQTVENNPMYQAIKERWKKWDEEIKQK